MLENIRAGSKTLPLFEGADNKVPVKSKDSFIYVLKGTPICVA